MRYSNWTCKILISGSCLWMLPIDSALATSYIFTTMGGSASHSYDAVDINNAGTVIGNEYDLNSNASIGWTYTTGVKTSFVGPPGAISTSLAGITNNGMVVGNYATTWVDDGSGTGTLVPGVTSIFSVSNGNFSALTIPGAANAQAIGVSPNGRWIVGTYDDAQFAIRGFAFDTLPGGTATFFNGASDLTVAAGVNNAGMVVGYERTLVQGVGRIGPAWTYNLINGQRTEFNVEGSLRTGARDISDSGLISGYYYSSIRPAIIHGFTGLGGNFESVNMPGVSEMFIYAANDAGALVGSYFDASDNQGAFLATPVPEPAGAWMAGVGLAWLALRRMRSKSEQRRQAH